MAKQKIAVLGGSFNPPTIAHKKLLETAISCLQADKGIFVPSSDQYVSRKMSRWSGYNQVYSESDRYNMLMSMCLGTDKLSVDLTEYGDDGHGHTYDTLCKIQEAYPDAEIIFIIGADKIRILPKWHSHDNLFKEFHFAVATRPDADTQDNAAALIQSIPKLKKFAHKFHLIPASETDVSDISSSVARNYIANKEWGKLANILTDDVIDIIKNIGQNNKSPALMDIKPKGPDDFLKEDPGLTEKITHDEYQSGVVGRSGNRKEHKLEDAYASYRQIVTGGKDGKSSEIL